MEWFNYRVSNGNETICSTVQSPMTLTLTCRPTSWWVQVLAHDLTLDFSQVQVSNKSYFMLPSDGFYSGTESHRQFIHFGDPVDLIVSPPNVFLCFPFSLMLYNAIAFIFFLRPETKQSRHGVRKVYSAGSGFAKPWDFLLVFETIIKRRR